jgi:CRISPR/Cas system endoribonuclease Cas6 (RAMP superfamily)
MENDNELRRYFEGQSDSYFLTQRIKNIIFENVFGNEYIVAEKDEDNVYFIVIKSHSKNESVNKFLELKDSSPHFNLTHFHFLPYKVRCLLQNTFQNVNRFISLS